MAVAKRQTKKEKSLKKKKKEQRKNPWIDFL